MKWRIAGVILMLFFSCAEAYGQGQVYKSADGAFQARFPASPVQEKAFTTDTPDGKVKSQTVYLQGPEGKILYTVTASVYPDNLEEKSGDVLDGVIQGLKINDRVINEQDIFLNGHSGKRILYEQHPDWSGVEMEVFTAGNCLYMITADGSNKEEDINNFFDSFKILK